MNETDFIAALRKLPLHQGARGLEDDCAVIELGSEVLIVTHDIMAEGTHYRGKDQNPAADMADVAWKLVAANLSDLAAKGADPIGVMLGFQLGDNDAAFLRGLQEVLEEYDVPLLGGDTVAASGARNLGLTALGRASHTPVPSRSGACHGDDVYVTGQIGCALMGFEGKDEHLDAFNRPQPLLGEGRDLAPIVHAMMDVSDGLLLDTFRLAQASEVTISLNSRLIPVAEAERLDDCIRWGDDYQLLFTAPADAPLPVSATKIGTGGKKHDAALWLDDKPYGAPDRLGYLH
jgi:thiamine-monophosphate kinase